MDKSLLRQGDAVAELEESEQRVRLSPPTRPPLSPPDPQQPVAILPPSPCPLSPTPPVTLSTAAVAALTAGALAVQAAAQRPYLSVAGGAVLLGGVFCAIFPLCDIIAIIGLPSLPLATVLMLLVASVRPIGDLSLCAHAPQPPCTPRPSGRGGWSRRPSNLAGGGLFAVPLQY